MADKQGAIERLNKMFGWVVDKSEIGQPGDFAKLSDEELETEVFAYLIEMGIGEEQARALLKLRRSAGEATQ